jgi:hypothetical protein
MKRLAHPRRHAPSPERAGGAIFFRNPKPAPSAIIQILAVFLAWERITAESKRSSTPECRATHAKSFVCSAARLCGEIVRRFRRPSAANG